MKKFVYKNDISMKNMHIYYERALNSLNVAYEEQMIDTTFGETHVLMLGDKNKKKIFTLHGGNGINPLNVRIFKPLLNEYCIIAPDVIGMPGKSSPYRNLSSKKDDYGIWINEIMKELAFDRAMFVVSSYSSAMLLSLAKISPHKISKAVLLVPSGIAHGPIWPIVSSMAVPFIKYYSHPTSSALDGIMQTMITDGDTMWREFMHLMMSGYKMEMRPPREFKAKELSAFVSPLFIIASTNDVFFPAVKVFKRAEQIFQGKIQKMTIEDRHLPSEKTMEDVCGKIIEFDHLTSDTL